MSLPRSPRVRDLVFYQKAALEAGPNIQAAIVTEVTDADIGTVKLYAFDGITNSYHSSVSYDDSDTPADGTWSFG